VALTLNLFSAVSVGWQWHSPSLVSICPSLAEIETWMQVMHMQSMTFSLKMIRE